MHTKCVCVCPCTCVTWGVSVCVPITLSWRAWALFVSIKLFNYRSTFQLWSLLLHFLSAQPAHTNRLRVCVCVCVCVCVWQANKTPLRTVQPYATDRNTLIFCFCLITESNLEKCVPYSLLGGGSSTAGQCFKFLTWPECSHKIRLLIGLVIF